VSGTPTAGGTSRFSVKVQDNNAHSDQFTVYLTIGAPAITLSCTSGCTGGAPPNGTQGVAYGPLTFTAAGGQSPYTFSSTFCLGGPCTGTGIAGLTLTSTGATTASYGGTPTKSGTASITFQARDANGNTGPQVYTIRIGSSGTLIITTTSLPGGTVGTPYTATLAANGGTLPYTWSILLGALPTGLSLNASTGAITGTPTMSGTVSFTVKVTDSAMPANQATQPLSITVTGSGTPAPTGMTGAVSLTGNGSLK